jgi:hypothetical protein
VRSDKAGWYVQPETVKKALRQACAAGLDSWATFALQAATLVPSGVQQGLAILPVVATTANLVFVSPQTGFETIVQAEDPSTLGESVTRCVMWYDVPLDVRKEVAERVAAGMRDFNAEKRAAFLPEADEEELSDENWDAIADITSAIAMPHSPIPVLVLKAGQVPDVARDYHEALRSRFPSAAGMEHLPLWWGPFADVQREIAYARRNKASPGKKGVGE